MHRKPTSWWQKLRSSPCKTLAKELYCHRIPAEPPPCDPDAPITVVCISDTHNAQPALPPGDLLIHAGDLTQNGSATQLQTQLDWLNAQPHTHKVLIAGNHDTELGEPEAQRAPLRWGNLVYLNCSSTSLLFPGGRRLKIYGHPWTRRHGNWAFQYERGEDVFSGRVDVDVDVLVTHSPPKFYRDFRDWGDEFLLRELWRVRPKLHVFGHVHEGYGCEVLGYEGLDDLYQGIWEGRGGWMGLLGMIVLLGWTWMNSLFAIERSGLGKRRTMLVNAAMTGGWRDKMQREPRVIQL